MAAGMALTDYYKPVTTRMVEALKEGFKSRFKVIIEGDPIDIPVAWLPCIIVEKTDGAVVQDATGLDEQTSVVVVKVLMNKRADFGSSRDKQITPQILMAIIEGRDPVTREYLSDSVLGIIRRSFTLSSTIVDQAVALEYAIGFRPADLISAEGRATFTITELIQVPNRT